MKKTLFVLGIWGILLSCHKSTVSNPDPQDGPYFPKVKLIIHNNCLSCHSPGGAGMPTDLTTDQNIVNLASKIKSATSDPVSPSNPRMPQGGELQQSDKDIIIKWVAAGGTATD